MKAQLNNAIFWIQKKPQFKLLASVKLAIPLLLIVALAVAWGTVVESKYNAEMAKIVVYNSFWLTILMTMLWINIFCATLARYPFRKSHTGFVITHIGLLMLLAGGVITTQYGVDGSLAVVEGQSDNTVALPKLVFGIAAGQSSHFQTVEIDRSLSETTKFDRHNRITGHIATIERYLPFAEVQSSYRTADSNDDWAVGFKIKSPFFDVAEFLHSELKPSLTMGPAQFELQVGKPKNEPMALAQSKKTTPKSVETFRILNAKDGRLLQQVPLADLRKKGRIQFNKVEIELKNVFQAASVSAEGISEAQGIKPNPALELNIKVGDQSYREVVFARFPEFSLARNPAHELKFQYTSDGNASNEGGSLAGGHTARFYIDPANPEQATLDLIKDGHNVMRKVLKQGETAQSPWMGMQVTLTSIVPKAEAYSEAYPIEPKQREDMPPGALRVLPKGAAAPIWIREGEAQTVTINDRDYSLYFGRKMFRLPFTLNLKKFHKKDYPGTETPMSFESDVTVSQDTQEHTISMNEPLYHMGYTLYQSSYQLNPNGPAVSIFSVNYDPGRQLKYFGSLVLCLGIVVFTLQRSTFFKNLKRRSAT